MSENSCQKRGVPCVPGLGLRLSCSQDRQAPDPHCTPHTYRLVLVVPKQCEIGESEAQDGNHQEHEVLVTVGDDLERRVGAIFVMRPATGQVAMQTEVPPTPTCFRLSRNEKRLANKREK